jgi:hypothetical protein
LLVYQYSDDTIFANKITCEDDCIHLQNALRSVEVWMEQHHMRVDNEKCNSMTFSLGKETFKSDFTYALQGKQVKKLKSMKYLGIMISDNFSQKKQFYHAIDNVKKDFYIELCHALDSRPELKIICYEQYVRSRLESSCAVWSLPFLPKNLNKILEMEEIQNKVFLAQESGLRNLAERRLLFTLGTLAKVLNREEPYLEMLKWLDLCNPSFKRSHFDMMLMNSDRSIIGNALKELVLLWFYFFHGDSKRATETIASLMKNFNSNSTVLRKFCNMRFQKFTSFCFDDDKVSLDLALLIVNKCLHPQLSLSQLELKIENSKIGPYYTAEPDDIDSSIATSRPERLAERTESVEHRMTFENCVRTVTMSILSLLMFMLHVLVTILFSPRVHRQRNRWQQRQPYRHHRR